MSNRSMLEFNHDLTPHTADDVARWIDGLARYLRSGDPAYLPKGVTWFGIRHHSSDCPLGEPPLGWQNEKARRTT